MDKVKIILFDVDGVLIRLPHYFSVELAGRGYENAIENLNEYFHGDDNKICLEGKGDAQKMIVPYLERIGWHGTSGEYFKEQFDFESKHLDGDIILLIKKLRKLGIKCCLCTDQIENRALYLLKNLHFEEIFDRHYISCRIGFRKCHEDFWGSVIEDLKKDTPGLDPGEIVFFDDIQNNLDVASKMKIKTFLFKDVNMFKEDMDSLRLN